ncbi:unnamed protein product [Calypogeia fissa]
MDPQGVRAIVFDDAVLFRIDSAGALQFTPDAPRFLLRLHYSNLLLGILARDGCSDSRSQKEALLDQIGVLGAVRFVPLGQELITGAVLKDLGSVWGVASSRSVYVSANRNDFTEGDISNLGWKLVHFVSGKTGTENLPGLLANVEQLNEINVIFADLTKRALGTSLVIVGHVMKWSRELDFLKRGAFPVLPNQYGLSFMPIHLDLPLEKQLAVVDVVLHKATDETLTIPTGRLGFPDSVKFSKGMLDLQRYLKDTPRICVVDPLDRILPLLDRVATQNILRSLKTPLDQVVRSPRSVEVTNFEEPCLSQALDSTSIGLPAIVKPRIACGASEAHTMAVVFEREGFNGLRVPLPAVIQEYVDHGAFQYKMYIVGDKLLCACRKSTPNGEALAVAHNNASSIIFDSLKSLPVAASTGEGTTTHSGGGLEGLNLQAVKTTSDWLRNKLGLTIIGFDLVVQAGTSDYVIVDVNYFPSFKDVPDAEAIPAFWDALVSAHRQWPGLKV